MTHRGTTRLLAVYAVFAVMALLGFYWDEVWHTDRGRDSFWIPAHQMLYAGVTGIFLVAVSWILILSFRQVSMRDIMRNRPLMLVFIGSSLTLLDAPIDGFWHNAYGRDAVFWSPPHVLAVASLFTVASGMLLLASRQTGRSGQILTPITAALAMGALVVLMMEYDSDVPQFTNALYLPGMVLHSMLAFSLVGLVTNQRWIFTITAVAYTAMMGLVLIFLTTIGFSTPILPAFILPAIALDLMTQRRWPLAARALVYAAVLFLVYGLYLNIALGGVQIHGRDVLLGLPLAFLLGIGVLLATTRGKVIQPGPAATALALIASMLIPATALAHDPGQGEDVGFVHFTANRTDHRIDLSALVTEPEDCSGITSRGLVARRARQEVRSDLVQTADCEYTGSLTVTDRGRWFVYIELVIDDRDVEAWLPVIAGDSSARYEKRSWIYVPPDRIVTSSTIVFGGLIYLLSLGLFTGVVLVFRDEHRARVQRRHPPGT